MQMLMNIVVCWLRCAKEIAGSLILFKDKNLIYCMSSVTHLNGLYTHCTLKDTLIVSFYQLKLRLQVCKKLYFIQLI